MVIIASMRMSNNPSHQIYDNLRARGKTHKVAMIACIRRLLVRINAQVRDWLAAGMPEIESKKEA